MLLLLLQDDRFIAPFPFGCKEKVVLLLFFAGSFNYAWQFVHVLDSGSD